jgi:ABC-type dipeptide/oligopeptide/nickel transport system permease component
MNNPYVFITKFFIALIRFEISGTVMRMAIYIARRLLLLIPVLLGVSLIVFTLTRVGGDPAAIYINPHMDQETRDAVRESLHLNDDILTQYFYWLLETLKGNWGYAASNADLPVTDTIAQFWPATFELAFISFLFIMPIGMYLGVHSAVKRDHLVDHSTRVMALTFVSIPIFVIALLLQYVFFYLLGWLPATGRYDEVLFFQYSDGFVNYTGFFLIDTLLNGNLTMFYDGLQHLILPALALSLTTVALVARLMRSVMLDVLNQDYVKTARAKGAPEKTVIKKHARRNALIPIATVGGLLFGGLLGGAVITETIFAWPGLGSWSARAMIMLDTASIMGFVLITAIVFVLSNLIVDILYAYLDPRVKLG